MRKYIITLFLLLISAFPCSTPYAVRFQKEHMTYPPGDPLVASFLYPAPLDRIEYGFYKQVCPGKPMKSIENSLKFLLTSDFVKKAVPNVFGKQSVTLLPAATEAVSRIVSDSLSDEAMSYDMKKEAMAAAIGTALASDYSCSSIESASRLYYSYNRDDFVADLCGKNDALKRVVNLLKGDEGDGLVAVPFKSPVPPSFADISSRNPRVGRLLSDKIITRREALELLVKDLNGLPLCHEVVEDYMDILKDMADSDDIYFFPLYDSIRAIREDCPVRISGNYELQEISGDVLLFTDQSGAEVPLVYAPQKSGGRVPEKLVLFDVEGPVPIKGGDVWIEDIPQSNINIPLSQPSRLNMGYLALVPLVGIVAWRFLREKET